MPRAHMPLLTEAMRFALWAAQQPRPPSWQQVQGFLNCSSTKARQWRRFYLNAIPCGNTPGPAATGNTQHQEQAP